MIINEMKKIIITSHNNDLDKDKMTSKYKDIYDSKIELYTRNNELLFKSDYFNVDSSNKYLENQGENNRKIEIKNGKYFGICGKMKSGIIGIMLFRYNPKIAFQITNIKQIFNKYYNELYLPTTNPNPLHDNKHQAVGIWIHAGGGNYDWSAGCLTLYADLYDLFIKNFYLNEIVEIEKI